MNKRQETVRVSRGARVRSDGDRVMVILGVILIVLLVCVGYLTFTAAPDEYSARKPKGPVKNPPPRSDIGAPCRRYAMFAVARDAGRISEVSRKALRAAAMQRGSVVRFLNAVTYFEAGVPEQAGECLNTGASAL